MSRSRLTPIMEEVLRALEHGELEHTPAVWRSTAGVAGLWNSHTLSWLQHQGYVRIRAGRATIRAAGKLILGMAVAA